MLRMRLIALLSILFRHTSWAQEAAPFQIERSQVVEFESKRLKRSYDLYIKLPRDFSEAKDKSYPVLILNDGGYAFPLVSSITRQLVNAGKLEELLIVGLSYSNEVSWQISRTRDYTPTYSPNESNYHSLEAQGR